MWRIKIYNNYYYNDDYDASVYVPCVCIIIIIIHYIINVDG